MELATIKSEWQDSDYMHDLLGVSMSAKFDWLIAEVERLTNHNDDLRTWIEDSKEPGSYNEGIKEGRESMREEAASLAESGMAHTFVLERTIFKGANVTIEIATHGAAKQIRAIPTEPSKKKCNCRKSVEDMADTNVGEIPET